MKLLIVTIIAVLIETGIIYSQQAEINNLRSNPLVTEKLVEVGKECPKVNCPKAEAYQPVGGCSVESCLFRGSEAIEGYGKVTGYYTTYQTDEFITNNKVTCDSFIVTGGTKALIDSLNEWIDNGNGMNRRVGGKLNLTIFVNGLDSTYKSLIKNSSETNQVELKLIRKTPVGRMAGSCESVVDIIGISSPIN